jgi:transcriptional regulator with XRE-family HTH domain
MLSKIENNSRRPTKDVIDRLSKYFHVEKEQLVIAFYSDAVVDKLKKQKGLAKDILKAATKKIELVDKTPTK